MRSNVGLNDASLYDAFTSSWSRLPDMNAGRWYPTNTTLSNGDVLVLSGDMNGSGNVNTLPQRYLAASRTWKDMATARLALPLYPKMFLAPSGRLFYAGPSRASRWLRTAGTGTWSTGPTSNYGTRSYGPAVYLDARVYLIGGGDPPTATNEVIDLAASSPSWRYVASMTTRRRQHNATLLPDGTVLVTGGSSGSGFDNASTPVLHSEVYDPAANTWKRLASITGYRGYHESQRLLTLPFTSGTGGLTVTAPTFNSRAPPGYYQLFLVNDVGVPSVGRMVRVLRRPTTTAAGALQEEE